MTALFEAERVAKRYGDTTALHELTLCAEPGRPLALLGRNGAGKTTVVRMLATLTRPDSGVLRVLGHDTVREAAAVRRAIGLAGQHATVEPLLTGRENLEMIGVLFGLTRRDARTATNTVLERLALTDAADRRVGGYSGGLRRRLDLGASLVGRPRLLLLDEPTTGLDPAARHGLWSLVGDLVNDGIDVLLTTQYLEEADVLAGRVVVMDGGRILADGTPDELKAAHAADVVTVRLRRPDDLDALRVAVPQRDVTVDPQTCVMTWTSPAGGEDAARCYAAAHTDAIEEITVRRPTLEEAFLNLTGSAGGAPVEVAV
ncbi:ATP-binding cassette domain-containing protein [Nocardia otitidiscaviarum]|uniref:ATP-binding cassette domain-containing protein n=1 Tax=Nocardia otitidiscaviarum TaxID=1823 RepID=UPI001895E214|nr:ATP-binding cassette domain-containing protein [Nocardia otitidiscaviarum]MBF6237009.1 ATP-binding cassette domain-containing protein [Nocardia otitidiscaviarum]